MRKKKPRMRGRMRARREEHRLERPPLSVNWRQKGLLLWCCQAPDGQGLQSVPDLRCSPMSGEVNMSAGSIVSEAVHREPLGDVNRIQLQGTKVEVLKCL